jgi:hypothetical protein
MSEDRTLNGVTATYKEVKNVQVGMKSLTEFMDAKFGMLFNEIDALRQEVAELKKAKPQATAPQGNEFKLWGDAFVGVSKAGKDFIKLRVKLGEEWLDVLPGPKHANECRGLGKFSIVSMKLGEIKRSEYNGKPQASCFAEDFRVIERKEAAVPPPSEYDAPPAAYLEPKPTAKNLDPMGFETEDSLPF